MTKTESFILKAKLIHGKKYDYSKAIYTKSGDKVIIVCLEHGEFLQAAGSHLQGCGCMGCAVKNRNQNIKNSSDEFILKAKGKHGDRYDYSKTEYNGSHGKISIICQKHGIFIQSATNHLSGNGCPKCRSGGICDEKSFSDKASEKHNGEYDYSLVKYSNSKDNVKIICKTHGVFEQTPSNHILGTKCPICSNKKSQHEDEIFDFVKSLGLIVDRGRRDLMEDGKEVDIFIPSKKIAIEFNGLYWHSENGGGKDRNYHLGKTNALAKSGIRLIHIFEDEYTHKPEIVKARLKSILINLPKIHARKCEIREISVKEKNEFLNKTHIQGDDRSSVSLGAFFEGLLVAVMTFCKARVALGHKNSNSKVELSRFSTVSNFRVIGIAGKLLTYYERKHKPKEIISYADKRWSEGGLYKSLGFTEVHESKPNYWYWQPKIKSPASLNFMRRSHRFCFARHRLSNIFNEDFPLEKTEWQIMKEKGYDRIWDCGNILFSKKFS